MIGSRGVGSYYGGIERVLDELCPRLATLGHEIDVYSRVDVSFQDHGGVRAIRTPGIGGKHLENISRSVFSSWRAIGQYDLIHFHAIGPGILSAMTRLSGQKSLVTIHGLDQKRDKWGAAARFCLGLAARTLAANADEISVVSEGLRRYFLERYDKPVTFIPNGLPRKKLIPPGALLEAYGLDVGRYILFASRLTPEKGCHDLIAAFNLLDTPIRLVIAGGSGNSDYIATLRAQADPAKVIFVGHHTGDALAELFSNAYMFVLPSYIEGMSMALLESLAFGIPALVSDIPENRAVVMDHGFYFPPQNVTDLRMALAKLIEEPHRVAEARRRLKTLRHPDWDSVARRYDKLYRATLHSQQKIAVDPVAAFDHEP
jgi:glycosyltransferase involved in cell wall biosynthesis